MPTNHQDRRLEGADKLQKAVASLATVAPSERQKFLYDRLMSHVDDICAAHKNGSTPCFNSRQVEALKDVAFQLAMSFNSQQDVRKVGFIGRLIDELRQMKPSVALGAVFAALITLSGFINGAIPTAKGIIDLFQYLKTERSEPGSVVRPPIFTLPEFRQQLPP